MRKLGLALAAAGAASLACAGARADTVVYNGGSPNQLGTYYADTSGLAAVYISFVLPTGVSDISDAEWWGGCYPATNCGSSPSFTIGVFADTGGSGPDLTSPIEVLSVGTADQTATGNLITTPGLPSYTEYVYNVGFPAISLTPGTTYWFGITGTTGMGDFGVETTSNAPAGALAYQQFFPTAPGEINAELALSLTAPEPSTWAMMLLGFAGLGFLGYRKRAALMA